jgi:FlaG/FlaF family flagellin (archaellin)
MGPNRGGNHGNRGVSTVVGVVLVVALAVIISALVGGYVFQTQQSVTQEPAPQVNWEYEYDESANGLTIRHEAGDTLRVEEIFVRYEADDSELRWDNAGPGSASWANSSTSDNGEVSANDEFVVEFSGPGDVRDGVRIYWRTQGNPEKQSSALIGGWELDG